MWDELFKNPEALTGFGGGRLYATEGKKCDDIVDAITQACFMSEEQKMLKINASNLRMGDHIHLGVDEGIGESWMDRRRINPDLSGLVSSVGINAVSSGIHTITIQGKVHRECPPNKVVKYTQLIWDAKRAVRDNLANMKVNDFYHILAKSTSNGYLSNSSVSTTIEVWFEDDRQFHVYENDVRVFQSNSAKATANFLETGEK